MVRSAGEEVQQSTAGDGETERVSEVMEFENLDPGTRIQLGDAEFIVIRAASGQRLDLEAGTVEGATLLGKRYVSEALGLELLCVRPGAGPILCNGDELGYAVSKPLPSSD